MRWFGVMHEFGKWRKQPASQCVVLCSTGSKHTYSEIIVYGTCSFLFERKKSTHSRASPTIRCAPLIYTTQAPAYAARSLCSNPLQIYTHIHVCNLLFDDTLRDWRIRSAAYDRFDHILFLALTSLARYHRKASTTNTSMEPVLLFKRIMQAREKIVYHRSHQMNSTRHQT